VHREVAVAVGGMHWTNGSRLTADRVAEADAPAIGCLRAAGAIVLATTGHRARPLTQR
jgi:Asp-tRNA(Asn)/Glu-tRNA(Gln) amidotransferase A subunit family amidase